MELEEIIADFEFLDDWEDRYKFLIELGNQLEPLPDAYKTGAHKVQGCVSQVWLVSGSDQTPDPVITFTGDSDAHIVRGLIAVAFAVFSGKRASEIVEIDETPVFERLGLTEHITPQRSNGLRSLVKRIKSEARQSLETA